MTSIEALYAAHPELYSAEHEADHRVEARLPILDLVKSGTVAAELGVFTGLYAEAILGTVRPAVLHVVDPWWIAYGDLYPNWGAYTAQGTLPTRVAHEAAVTRVEAARGDCEVQIHVTTSADWLRSLPDASLDWVYLDSTHHYRETLEELTLLSKKLRPNGLVLGDDWFPDPEDTHHAVFRAIHELVRKGMWDVIRADHKFQWALRPALEYPPAPRRGAQYRQALRGRIGRLLRR
ncbi:MAG: class I SAM-dependent methyltransferase [Gaiellaceae bacterium]